MLENERNDLERKHGTGIYFLTSVDKKVYDKNQELLKKIRDVLFEIKKEDFALTCNGCGNLAIPIQDTDNRYRCKNCRNQFAGARHRF